MSIEEITNFVTVTPWLVTGGQPSEQQLRELAASNFQVVVNLGLLDADYSLSDEAGLVRALGLAYHHIPVDFEAPTVQDLEGFIAVMDASRGQRIFVHCALNMRVSIFVSLYGQARLGWSAERADALIQQVWTPDEVWTRFIAEARESLTKSG